MKCLFAECYEPASAHCSNCERIAGCVHHEIMCDWCVTKELLRAGGKMHRQEPVRYSGVGVRLPERPSLALMLILEHNGFVERPHGGLWVRKTWSWERDEFARRQRVLT